MQSQRDSQWQQPEERTPDSSFTSVNDAPEPVVTMTPDPEEDETGRSSEGDEAVVRWQAAEYIHHNRSALWYTLFGFITLLLTAVALFFKAWTFALLVPVMAAALFVYSRRPPRIIDYTLSRKGLHINDQLYPFASFRGFGVIRDADEFSIMLMPTKRFQPGVYVYFPEEAGEAIVDMLAARLPMLNLKLDLIDRIIRQLRM